MPDLPDKLEVLSPDVPQTPDLDTLLPFPSIEELTPAENQRHQQLMTALVVLGQAAGAALVCPGNQEGVADSSRCAYAAKCELLRAHKAPEGQLCPIEREIILSSFGGWCKELNVDPKNLGEADKADVSELTWISVQEQRCANILSRGEAARLTQVNVKDSNPETGDLIAWERVINANQLLQDNLHTRRRMLKKELMLTREQKFKIAKTLNQFGKNDDLSKKMSSMADKLSGLVIDAEFEELPEKK
jgi:hypothetical protein